MLLNTLSILVSWTLNLKGHTGDRQWWLGSQCLSHTVASNRQNLYHVFSAFHVLSHYTDHGVKRKGICQYGYVKLSKTSQSLGLQKTKKWWPSEKALTQWHFSKTVLVLAFITTITYLYSPIAVKGQCRRFMILSYIFCAKIGSLKQQKYAFEILDAARASSLI